MDNQLHAQAGKKITHIEDDPYAAATSTLIHYNKSQLESMQKSSDQVKIRYESIQSILSQSNGFIAKARSLAVQAANMGNSTQDLKTIKNIVESILESLISLANTQVDGNYVLGGYQNDQAPYNTDGEFQGNDGVNKIEVSPGLSVPHSMLAQDIFFNPSGNENAIQSLKSFMQALDTEDIQGIKDSISSLQDASNYMSNAQAKLGGYLTNIQSAQIIRDNLKLNYEKQNSDLVEGDYTELLSRMVASETAYNAAIQQASRMMNNVLHVFSLLK
jgi:flagellar hook-associated protein 3 FlgL